MKRHRVKHKVVEEGTRVEATATSGPLRWGTPVHLLLVVLLGVLVYVNSLAVPFMFDDLAGIANNPVIRSFDCFPHTSRVFAYPIEHQDIKNNLYMRPLAYFTFAVNYRFHGLNVAGYHLVNLLLHIGCALLLYLLCRQLLGSPAMQEKTGSDPGLERRLADYLPLVAALMFVSHPLNTQAVTYIIQRFVPLATFFFLAAICLYMAFRSTGTLKWKIAAYLLSLAAAVLAMEAKEIAFTLPVVIVLVELMFFWARAGARAMMLAPFLLTMAIIPLKVAQLAAVGRPAPAEGFSMAPLHMANFRGIPVTDYLMSQFAVVITYLRLLLVPVGLNFDHDFPLRTEFLSAGVLLPLAVLIAIFSTGFWLLLKSRQNRACRLVSLGIFWFFITLSVESSIVPIEDLIFEHRVYLPSLGFFLAVTTGCAILLQRLGGKTVVVLRAAAVLAVTVILLGSALTVARNRLWQNEVAFWKDAAEKSPAKARPNRWYGAALLQREMAKQESDRDMGPACAILEKAVRLGPQDPQNHQVLAEVRVMQKNYGEALRSLAEVARLRPLSPKPHLARGEILEAEGDFAGACQAYLDAARVAPRWHVPHMKLAGLYLKQGNESLAVRSLEEALRIHPDETARKQLEELKGRSRSVGTL